MIDFFLRRIEAVHDGRKGLFRALESDADIIILNDMLPAMNGFEGWSVTSMRSTK